MRLLLILFFLLSSWVWSGSIDYREYRLQILPPAFKIITGVRYELTAEYDPDYYVLTMIVQNNSLEKCELQTEEMLLNGLHPSAETITVYPGDQKKVTLRYPRGAIPSKTTWTYQSMCFNIEYQAVSPKLADYAEAEVIVYTGKGCFKRQKRGSDYVLLKNTSLELLDYVRYATPVVYEAQQLDYTYWLVTKNAPGLLVVHPKRSASEYFNIRK